MTGTIAQPDWTQYRRGLMRTSTITLALITSLAAPSSLSAHTRLTSPTPRNNDSGLKTGPCGNVAPTGDPNVYAAGATIEVSWQETVDHPGYYRIAFSPGDDQGYDDNILLDDIPDVQCTNTPCSYSADVTLPAEPCEGCSLQIIQFMGTGPNYSPYFSCADLELVDDGTLPDEMAGCCSAGGGDTGSLLLLALVALMCTRLSRGRNNGRAVGPKRV